MMKLSHRDLEHVINHDSIDEQSEEYLKALLKVPKQPSKNPRYNTRIEEAQRRIQLRLREFEVEKEKRTPHWNRIFMYIGLASLAASVIVFLSST